MSQFCDYSFSVLVDQRLTMLTFTVPTPAMFGLVTEDWISWEGRYLTNAIMLNEWRAS